MKLQSMILQKLSVIVLLAVFNFSCESNEVEDVAHEVATDYQFILKTSASKALYGEGEANYSTVQMPDKPTVYSTRYYPLGTTAADINAAINTANAAGGGTVELSSGTYSLSEPIIMKSNVRLLGQGIGSTILERGTGFPTSTYSFLVGANNASLTDVEIRSVSIDGGYTRAELEAEPPTLIGIAILSDVGYYNERVRVIYCEVERATMGIHMKGTTHITIQSSDIHDNGGSYLDHNIYFRRIGHVLLYLNDIYDSVGGSGVKFAGGTTNVSNESRYFTVRQNNINNNERINLNVQGCHHLLIEDNELESQNSSISNMAGMFLIEYNGYECRYTDIINNSIINNTSNGVYVNGCRTFNIEGNTVSNNGTNYNIINSSDFTCDYNN